MDRRTPTGQNLYSHILYSAETAYPDNYYNLFFQGVNEEKCLEHWKNIGTLAHSFL